MFAMAAVFWTGDPIHIALAAFIFFAARNEEAQVRYEERHRSVAQAANAQGMWVAPPGYHWVDRGNGLWQLAPMGVKYAEPAEWDASAWR